MAIQFLPMILAAARGIAAAGRVAFAGGGRAIAAARAVRLSSLFGGRRDDRGDDRPTHAEALANVQSFYRDARRQIQRKHGTFVPSMAQYAGVARQQRELAEQQRLQDAQRRQRERMVALAKVTGGVTAAFGGLLMATKSYSNRAVQTGDSLRQFDARIGLAMARLDIGRLRREYRRAGEVGGGVAALVEAQNRREEALAPISHTMERWGNMIRVRWTNVQTNLALIGARAFDRLDKLTGIARAAESLLEWLEKKSGIDADDQKEFQHNLKDWLRRNGRMNVNEPPGGNGGFPGPGGMF